MKNFKFDNIVFISLGLNVLLRYILSVFNFQRFNIYIKRVDLNFLVRFI